MSSSDSEKPAIGSAARSVMGLLSTRIVANVVAIVTAIFVARALGPTDRGFYALLQTIAALSAATCDLGIGFGFRFHVSSKQFDIRTSALPALALGLAHGGVTALVLFVLYHFQLLGQIASQISLSVMAVVIVTTPLRVADTMMSTILVGDSQFGVDNAVQLARRFLHSGLLLLAVVVFPFGLEGAVLAGAVATVVMLFVYIGYIWIQYRPVGSLSLDLIRRTYSYGLRAWGSTLAQRANIRADQFLLAYFVAPEMLGYYAVAASISELTWAMPSSVSVVLFNRIAGQTNEDARRRMIERTHRTLLWSVGVSAVAGCVLSIWALPWLYGEAYAPAVPLLWLLIPGAIAMVSHKVMSKYLSGTGHPELTSAGAISGALIGVTLYAAIIPFFGIGGAAVACSLGYFATAVVTIYFYKRKVSDHPTNLLLLQGADVAWAYGQFAHVFRPKSDPPTTAK